MKLLTKTQAAFWFTADRFFKKNKHVYFWTFTFKHVPIDDAAAMEDWNTFAARLAKHFPFCQGLRVCELHHTHGIHFHFLVNIRLPVRRLRRIFYGSGRLNGHNRYLDFGWIKVRKVAKEEWLAGHRVDLRAAEYMMEYMTKSYRSRMGEGFRGRRMWGTIGGLKASRCRDIVYESDTTRNRCELFGVAQCGYSALRMIQHYTMLHGRLCDWPDKAKRLVLAQHGNENFMKAHIDRVPF